MEKHSSNVSMDSIIPLVKEQLAMGEDVKFSPRGISMLPMLRQGIDSIVLSPLPQKLKKYDIPLYQRENGAYVLHRIIKTGDTYTCMGDNQFTEEPGLHRSQMIGYVTGFYRGDKLHSTDEAGYRRYCVLWCNSRALRRFVKRATGWLKRHIK